MPPPPIAPDGPGQVPYGYPGPQQAPYGGAPYPVGHGYAWPGMQPPPSNGMGTASLVLGIISAVGFLMWPVALVLGILAPDLRRDRPRQGPPRRGDQPGRGAGRHHLRRRGDRPGAGPVRPGHRGRRLGVRTDGRSRHATHGHHAGRRHVGGPVPGGARTPPTRTVSVHRRAARAPRPAVAARAPRPRRRGPLRGGVLAHRRPPLSRPAAACRDGAGAGRRPGPLGPPPRLAPARRTGRPAARGPLAPSRPRVRSCAGTTAVGRRPSTGGRCS
ncbi:hypothetical protein LT493_18655 [Streptomyces tricolor]|nr:hypothetical protein [Streptomyces tricolor]